MRVFPIFSVAFLVVSCNETPSEEDHPYLQEHIPWPSLADSPWPMVWHDPQGTNRSQYTGPQIGELITTIPDSLFLDGSCVIDENNNIYYITNDRYVQTLHKRSEDGSFLWKFQFEGIWGNGTTPVLTSENTIYIHGLKQTIYVLNDDGSLARIIALDRPIESNIMLDKDGNLYFLTEGPNHDLVSITPEGVPRWTLSAPDRFGTGELPLVFSPEGNTLYASTRDSLYAIGTDGSIKWKYGTKYFVGRKMVDNDGNIYFDDFMDSSIVSIYPSGELRWKVYYHELNIIRISSYAPTMDTNGNNNVYISGRSDQTPKWYFSSYSQEGELNWSVETPYQLYETPVILSDGRIALPAIRATVTNLVVVE